MHTIEVAAAVMYNEQGEVLCAQRADQADLAKKWEFPGGKIQRGESHEEALIREIKEELSLDINVQHRIASISHTYESFRLVLHVYEAVIVGGRLVQNVHKNLKWMPLNRLHLLDWAPANYVVLNKLQKS